MQVYQPHANIELWVQICKSREIEGNLHRHAGAAHLTNIVQILANFENVCKIVNVLQNK